MYKRAVKMKYEEVKKALEELGFTYVPRTYSEFMPDEDFETAFCYLLPHIENRWLTVFIYTDEKHGNIEEAIAYKIRLVIASKKNSIELVTDRFDSEGPNYYPYDRLYLGTKIDYFKEIIKEAINLVHVQD